jgi:hypothetical protein
VAAMPEGALHKQGFYVGLKLLDVGEPADLLPLALKLFPGGPQLTADIHSTESWRGIKIMVSLVEAMVRLSHASVSNLLPSMFCYQSVKTLQVLVRVGMPCVPTVCPVDQGHAVRDPKLSAV